MKKICLTVVGLYILFLNAISQVIQKDTAAYKAKPLKIEEVNLVTSYYSQDGHHSAILGGEGTEQLTDLANMFELKLVGYDKKALKHTISAGLGIDHHTAASAKYISKTGASSQDGTRVYPSLNWTVENEAKKTEFGLGSYISYEYNYQSFALDAHVAKKTNNNGEFNAKISAYFDQVKLIYPSELIPIDTASTSTVGGVVYITTASGRQVALSSSGGITSNKHDDAIPSSPRNTFNASFSFAQVLNQRLQAAVILDIVTQNGYLGLPYHRVYFTDGTEKVENLPSSRTKLPIGIRLNYFAGDKLIFRTFYRYYVDDWGLTAQTASIEMPYKITPFFSISPFYRYYTQTAVKYFAGYGLHAPNDTYYTSNYALSAFNSSFYGTGIRIAPPKGILNEHFSSLEIRYGHYTQTTDLMSNVISFEFKFK